MYHKILTGFASFLVRLAFKYLFQLYMVNNFSYTVMLLLLLSDLLKTELFKKIFSLGDDKHMTSIKITRIFKPPVHLRPKFFHPLDIGRSVSNEPPSPPFERTKSKQKPCHIQTDNAFYCSV